ncbi:MAG: methionine synthase [Pseudomonadota bacterium]
MGASGPGRSDSTVDAMAAVVVVAVVVGTVVFWLAGMPS